MTMGFNRPRRGLTRSPSAHVRVFAIAFAIATQPALGAELWLADPDPESCSILLVNELGGVTVEPGERIHVSSETPGLTINATHGENETTLAVSSPDGTQAGDVTLRVPPRCQVAVRTDRGAVDVELGPKPLPLTVETVTGDITARLDASVPVTIALATSGEITTDFTIDVEFKYHQEPAKLGTVSLERGGESVHLTSRRGAIRLLRTAHARTPRNDEDL